MTEMLLLLKLKVLYWTRKQRQTIDRCNLLLAKAEETKDMLKNWWFATKKQTQLLKRPTLVPEN